MHRTSLLQQNKWGDTGHHYDLMHPMIQHICKGTTYTRRTEIQHIEYQKHEDREITYRQRQTRIGDERTKQTYFQNSEKLGPEEEGNRRRDCAARQTMTHITILNMADCTKKRRRMAQ
eukprot:16428696-Heterocapsa_arctica.AAC.1